MFVSGKAMFIHVHRLSPTQQTGKGKDLNID